MGGDKGHKGDMCARCGKNEVRKIGTSYSKYCSDECGKAARADVARMNGTRMSKDYNPYRKDDETKRFTPMLQGYFPETTGAQDWRDAQFNPHGC